ETYHGDGLGAWSLECVSDFGAIDRSEFDRRARERALDYVADNRDRLPVVLAARAGRTWGVFDAEGQLLYDVVSEARAIELARLGLGAYYLLAAGAIAGVVVLRRRGVPSFPVTSSLVNVTITVLLFYGSTRFRAPAEP